MSPGPAPLYAIVKDYCKKDILRLHMPGHIGGKGISIDELKSVAYLDLTEVFGMDDLHWPTKAIREAQELLAQAYGAKESFMLVNGATSGIHALFMSLTGTRSKVLIPRNAHRAFFGAMVLSGAMPVYIPCKVNHDLGIAVAVTSQDIARLLNDNPDAEVVFITSPSYYGTTSRVEEISDIIHQRGKMLFIDEAHGGHFPFHPDYPKPGLASGADAVVNGLHKTLPVLNQGAVLHIGKSNMNRDRLFEAYSMLTTTSPSYPIMVSIDLARQLMVAQGRNLLERAYINGQQFRKKLNHLRGIQVHYEKMQNIPEVAAMDPLKLLISINDLDIDGYQLARDLRDNYDIQVELQQDNLILALMSIFHNHDDWERLYNALASITEKHYSYPRSIIKLAAPPCPQVLLSPRDAFWADKKLVSFAEAKGRLAGEMIVPYPPGIPCLLPGERIDEPMFEYLQFLKKSGVNLPGLKDPKLDRIMIING